MWSYSDLFRILLLLWQLEVEILNSLSFTFYKSGQESTQPENMCDIIFENLKCPGGTANRMSNYAEAIVQWGPTKKCSEEIQEIHKKTLVSESLFW